MSNTMQSDQAVTREQLSQHIGRDFSNVHLLRLERAGKFPKRFYLSTRSPVWYVRELHDWLAKRAKDHGRQFAGTVPEKVRTD